MTSEFEIPENIDATHVCYLQTFNREDPLGHMVNILRGRVKQCSPKLTRNKGPPSAPPPCLGCTGEAYDVYLEDQFQDGMSWDNYGLGDGKWQVDYKLAFFDVTNPATTKEEILRRFHYTNIQPVWSKDNMGKGMSWDNYGHGEGKWQVDHKLAFFDETNPATTKEEILRRFHYTNTQPMWSKDNMSEGTK